MLGHLEFVIFGLLFAVAALVMLSNVLKIPYPVGLVLGGLVLGFTPLVPNIRLPPNLVLLIFLPPILYGAAFFSSPRDLKSNLRVIGGLAVVLVAITTATAAVVAHFSVGMPWAAAFVLGAIVAPTDVVAATAIAGRMGAPRQIVTILEGESLVNDGTALVLYHVAVGVAVTGTFSIAHASLEFLLYGIGGIAMGLAVGWLIGQVRRLVEDRRVEVTISLLTGYAAYLPADALDLSGVLAAVAAALYLGWYSPEMTSARNRLQTFEVWEILPFLLNSILFILVGLQLPNILEALPKAYSISLVLLYAGVMCFTVMGTRVLCTFSFAYLPRYLSRRIRELDPYHSWQRVSIVAYTGMRGAVSLALALAVPLTTGDGSQFPERSVILFFTFCVILATLVPQGLTLPFLIRRLGLAGSEASEMLEEAEARLRVAEAALVKIDDLEAEGRAHIETIERMREHYEQRRRRYAARLAEQPEQNEGEEEWSVNYQRFRGEILKAERAALLELRAEAHLSDAVRRRLERELDLEDTRLEL